MYNQKKKLRMKGFENPCNDYSLSYISRDKKRSDIQFVMIANLVESTPDVMNQK